MYTGMTASVAAIDRMPPTLSEPQRKAQVKKKDGELIYLDRWPNEPPFSLYFNGRTVRVPSSGKGSTDCMQGVTTFPAS